MALEQAAIVGHEEKLIKIGSRSDYIIGLYHPCLSSFFPAVIDSSFENSEAIMIGIGCIPVWQ
ncbi:MAG: hypothetical protein GDA56_04610 [Hormoscilla sp. GM7CHS1pb]|nr:hypothetical protein [Hormoscilla sp. GM7CHS1pb]